MGKASTRAQNKYISKAYDRLNIVVPKGRKTDIEAFVGKSGSVNGLVNDLLRERMGLTEEQWKAPQEEEPPQNLTTQEEG